MNIVLWICGITLSIAAALAIIRLAKGPSILERVIATDVLLLIISAALCMEMAMQQAHRQPGLRAACLPGRVRRLGHGFPLRHGPEERLMLDTVIDVVAGTFMIVGCLMSLAAGIGMLRFPDLLSRLHAATKPQVLGLFLLLAALGLELRTWAVLPVLVLAWLLQLLTAPVSAHMVGRAGYRTTAPEARDPHCRRAGGGRRSRGASARKTNTARASHGTAPTSSTRPAAARHARAAGSTGTAAGPAQSRALLSCGVRTSWRTWRSPAGCRGR